MKSSKQPKPEGSLCWAEVLPGQGSSLSTGTYDITALVEASCPPNSSWERLLRAPLPLLTSKAPNAGAAAPYGS